MDHGKKLITDEMQEDGLELNTDLNYIELDEAPSEDTEENNEKYYSKGAKSDEKLPDDYWQNFDKIIPKSTAKKQSSSAIDVTVGDQIKHKKWGVGVIEDIQEASTNDKMLIIRFQTQGTKKLLQSAAPIEKI